jgi:uncharacterized damage-inducible protein DinB
MLIEAFQYKCWADRRTLDAAKALDERECFSTVAFIRQQLNHMTIVEELFKARLIGEVSPHCSTNTEVLPTLDELDQRLTNSNQWFTHYAEGLASERRHERVPFQFVDGKRGQMSRLEILFHIVNHGTYHRGAIGHALDLAKAARPADTYTVFIHSAQPDRRLQT